MREAGFITVFCGIETPEPHALRAIVEGPEPAHADRRGGGADQRATASKSSPASSSGLDTDDEGTADRIIEFIRTSAHPRAHDQRPLRAAEDAALAPPRGRRAARGGRSGASRTWTSCCRTRPVLGMWRRCIATAYDARRGLRALRAPAGAHVPEPLRLSRATSSGESWENMRMGLGMLARIVWRIGIRGRLPPDVLADGEAGAAGGQDRAAHPHRDGEPPPDRVHARLPARRGRVVVLRAGIDDRCDRSLGEPRCPTSSPRARRRLSRCARADARSVDQFKGIRSGGLSGVRPEIVVALGLRQARRNLLAMEEIAHDAIRHRPVVAVHAVMMRAQPGITGELKSTRSTQAHASGG